MVCKLLYLAGPRKKLPDSSPAGQIRPGWPQLLKEFLRDPHWLDLGLRKNFLTRLQAGWIREKNFLTRLLAASPAKFGHCPSLRIRAGGVGVTPTGEEVWRRGGLENLWEMQRFGYMAVVSAIGRRVDHVSTTSLPRLYHS